MSNWTKKRGQLALEASLDGKENSVLATNLAAMGKAKSRLASLNHADAAFAVQTHFTIPKKLAALFTKMSRKEFDDSQKSEKDPEKVEFGERFWKAIEPTLLAGELDYFLGFYGPEKDGHFTLQSALKLQHADALDKLFRVLAKKLSGKETEFFKLDVKKIGSVSVHQLDAQALGTSALEKALANEPISIGTTDDLLFWASGAVGEKSIAAMLEATPGTAPIVSMEASVVRFTKMIAFIGSARAKRNAALAKKIFGTDPGTSDRVRFTIEAGPNLKIRLGGWCKNTGVFRPQG